MNDEQRLLSGPHGEGWLEGVSRALYAVRVPMLVSIVTAVVLFLPAQVREVYRVLVQERVADPWHPHWLMALGSLLALAVVLWQIARQLAADADEEARRHNHTPHPVGDVVKRWSPRLLPVLPLLGVALGFWLGRQPAGDYAQAPAELKPIIAQLTRLEADLTAAVPLCIGLAVVLVLVFWGFERWLMPVQARRTRTFATVNNWLIFPALILGSILLFIRDPVRLPQIFGVVPIFALWVVNLLILITLFTRYYRLLGVPIIALLLIGLVLIEAFGLADNHRFRSVPAQSGVRPQVDDAFRAWLTSRQDLKTYQDAGQPYPVYIVAAEGGGLYAAYQTAKVLAGLQDLCPNFSQHVFAISSVSGGSLGAAVYSGLVHESKEVRNQPTQPCQRAVRQDGPLARRASTMLSSDMLSPVVWGTLFPDFLQRFIPYPVFSFDRAHALEYAFEDAWHRHSPAGAANPLSQLLVDSCGSGKPFCPDGAAPALALNVTNVETGMQMVLSQLNFRAVGFPWSNTGRVLDVFNGSAEPLSLRLSTAVGLSARFPWISPSGWFEFAAEGDDPAPAGGRPRLRRLSFVDGGFVDNSGVATAIKLAQHLNERIAAEPTLPRVQIKLIMISAAWLPIERFWMDKPKSDGSGDLVSPIIAAYTSWEGRGYTTQYDASAESRGSIKVVEAGFYYNFLPLPLGWQLSALSRRYIDLFRGNPAECDPEKVNRALENHASMAASYIQRAHCVAAEIATDLNPTIARPAVTRAITPVH